jgi:hypothetical protein
MNQESFYYRNFGIIWCCIGIVILLIALLVLLHDPFVRSQHADKIMNSIIINSDCSFLNLEYGDAKDKWFKSGQDNLAIKRMEDLKC